MRNLFLAFLFLPTIAFTQSQAKAETGVFIPITSPSSTPPPPDTGIPSAPYKTWRIVYFGEYQGPPLGNFDISKSQYPNQAPFYTEWDHYLKIGYALSRNVTMGTQFRAFNLTDPNAQNNGFGFYDQRFYISWLHMIDTNDVQIDGKFQVQVPTTDASRNIGEILSLRFEANVTLKTALRNWNFSCLFLLQPYFFNDPTASGGQTDLYIAALPYVTVSLFPNVQLLFEGEFDAAHNYNDSMYNLNSAYNDYLDIGPLFTINSHINTNVALRFFTDNVSFKAAALYVNIGVVL